MRIKISRILHRCDRIAYEMALFFKPSFIKKCWPIDFRPIARQYAALPKRFYRKVRVIENENNFYEITLDSKKLKTPAGNVFKFENESLALAVANEWDSQKEIVRRNSMHLTGLCGTAIDNPNRITKSALITNLIGFLDTDTILYHTDEDNELYRLQSSEWTPIIEWFNRKYGASICPVRGIASASSDSSTKESLIRFFNSHTFDSILGFSFAVENLKSVVLTLRCFDQEINVENAVRLSRLEEEYQSANWGRVEWAHDTNVLDTQSRVSSAIIFARLHSESSDSYSKTVT